jgi:hypothetical protein
MEEHYRLMALESQQEDAEYRPSNDDDADDDDDADAGDDYERRVIDQETTDSGAGAGGSETSSQANRRVWKKRRPNLVAGQWDTFTLVDPASGIPKEPVKFAKGYGLQLVAILHAVVNVNEMNLQSKDHLRVQLILRLHAQYEFPPEYRNKDLKKNIVNRYALTRFTKHLSSYKTMLRDMIADHEPFEEVHRHFPQMTEEDFKVFLANEANDFTKAQSKWGKDLAEKNIGHHYLGSRGYDGKKPKWDKEDQAYIEQGIENPYDRYADPLFRAFVRSWYRKETETGKLIMDPKVVQGIVLRTDPKVEEVEKVVVRNL